MLGSRTATPAVRRRVPRIPRFALPTMSTLALLALVLSSAAGSAVLSTVAAPAANATVPGMPQTVQPGTTVFAENFENGSSNAALGAQSYSALGSLIYIGAGGQTYTGSPKWINAQRCNGVILSYDNSSTPLWAQSGILPTDSGTNGRCSDSAGVRSYQFLRMLARAMGQQFTPASPTTNHVTSSYTECRSSSTGGGTCDILPSGQTNGVMFQTVTPLTVVPEHYYVFGVKTAYFNCAAAAADPQYQFAFTNGAAVTLLGAPLNGCQATSDPNVTTYTQSVTSAVGGNFGNVTKTVNLASMTTRAAFQAAVGQTTAGIMMWNANGTTDGNDGAFDDVSLIDVTPQLDKSFSPTLIAPGQTSTVTLTVTNTNELNAKNDWHITDALPANLTIAGSTVGGTCRNNPAAGALPFTAAAVAGSGTFTVTGGDIPSGQAFCTITFTVTSSVEGTYINGPGNITTNLNPPANATLTVRAPRIALTKALSTPREAATDQFTVALKTGGVSGTVVSSTASSTTTGSGSTVTAGSGTTGAYVATVGTAYTLTEAAAGTASLANYTATITCTDSFGLQTGLPTGAVFNPASPPTVTPVFGANISCVITNSAKPIMSWNKVVDKGAGTMVNPGDTLTYTVSITNSGSVPNPSFTAFDDLTNVVNNATFTAGSITVSPAGGVTASYDAALKRLNVAGLIPANSTVQVSYTVTVNAGAFGQVRNAFIDKTVVNPIGASLQWRKVDASAAKHLLAGSEWTLTAQPSGTPLVVTDCVVAPCTGADTDPVGGQLRVKGLTPGSYQLVETRAPVGFVLNPTPIAVTVSATTQTTVLADVVNQQQPVPVLPMTGGLGTDHLLIAGGGLLALMFGLGAWQFVRRRRTL